MPDFENGLPPANTSMTDKSVSDINFAKSIFEDHDTNAIQSLCYQQAEIQQAVQFKIENIVFSSERVGKNYVFYML